MIGEIPHGAATSPWVSKVRGPRGIALALLFAALALLVLRPFCDLAFAAAGQGDLTPAVATLEHPATGHADQGTTPSEACCIDIADEILVKPVEPLAAWMAGAPLGAALILFAGLPSFAGSRHMARRRLAAPPERPFYVRSARILR